MKRYLLFAGDYYYPDGGWSDFKGDFDSASEATNKLDRMIEESGDSRDYIWFHVVDTETWLMVAKSVHTSLPEMDKL